jgi:hypothetical protein
VPAPLLEIDRIELSPATLLGRPAVGIARHVDRR